MARTLKGQAADIVAGLTAQLPAQFAVLEQTLDERKSLCGGTTVVNALADAAAQFSSHCVIRMAQHIYASMSGPEESEAPCRLT